MHRIVQPRVKIVPEGTSSGSSSMCSKMVETVIAELHLQYPSPARAYRHRIFARRNCSKRVSSSLFRFSSLGKISLELSPFQRRVVCLQFLFQCGSTLLVTLHVFARAVESTRFPRILLRVFLAIMNLAGFSSCITAKYRSKLLLADSSFSTVNASGQSFHISAHFWAV